MKKAWGSEPLIFLIIYVLLKDTHIFVFVVHIFLLLYKCTYLHRITSALPKEFQQWSVSCCIVEIRVMKFITWPAHTYSFLHYAKCEEKTLTILASSALCWEGSAQFTLIFLLALGIRSITDIMEHNSPETHEIVPVFYQMVTQVSRNVFLLMEWFSSSSKSPVCSASPQAEKHSALLLLVCFSICIFQRKKH